MESKTATQCCAASGRGFTLVEILVAVFILAIVTSLVMGAFGGIYEGAERVNLGSDLHEMANACLNRMDKDLQSIHVTVYPRYKRPDIDDDPEIYHIKGETRSTGGERFGWLRFTSMAHLPFNQQVQEGIAEIVYYIQRTPENDFILRRADKLYPYPEEFEESDTDPIMCEHLKHFDLVYFDAKGREHEEWDSESDDMEFGTPRAIGIKLEVGTEELSYAFQTRIALPTYRYKEVKR
jgi:general secretion pathway protein J